MPTLTVTNPATGKTIETLEADSLPGVRTKYLAARAAQPRWANLPLRKRLDAIRNFRAAIEANRDELATIVTSEVGKPITQSHNELKGLIGRLDYFISESPRVLRSETVLRDRKASLSERITTEPLGVIANISAWNYPYFVGANVFVPALLMGNAVLYKPSEFAARTGLAIARLLSESG